MSRSLKKGPYAMVVGSYRLVDFDLNELPPGLVDHREWTRDNGRNNVLRINGFGAPRSFDTNLLRRHPLPNVSYGEDYAVALKISREYKIGRIYENLYWCRRWKENTDAGISVAKKNSNDYYKDGLRSREIEERHAALSAAAETSPDTLGMRASCLRVSRSRRAAKISKLPKRMNDGDTRHTTAPGSSCALPL